MSGHLIIRFHTIRLLFATSVVGHSLECKQNAGFRHFSIGFIFQTQFAPWSYTNKTDLATTTIAPRLRLSLPVYTMPQSGIHPDVQLGLKMLLIFS